MRDKLSSFGHLFNDNNYYEVLPCFVVQRCGVVPLVRHLLEPTVCTHFLSKGRFSDGLQTQIVAVA